MEETTYSCNEALSQYVWTDLKKNQEKNLNPALWSL